jgi:SAM-dependent methyltransferase
VIGVDGSYYATRLGELADLFGAAGVSLVEGGLDVDGRFLPVVDDVVVALDAGRLPPAVRARVPRLPGSAGPSGAGGTPAPAPFAGDVQRSFGEEWTSHPELVPDHAGEFEAYFDLVDLDSLAGLRVVDVGCGIGRWSHFLAPRCRSIVLVDYSEAIFVARRNLAGADNAIFVMADVLDLPFRPRAFDVAVCLGVLHHLPFDALDALRRLAPLAERHLAYLYYALDNRPRYFRWILAGVTATRRALTGIRSPRVRAALTSAIATGVYLPLTRLGTALGPVGLSRYVPLAEAYGGKSRDRLRQEVYDRFFTSIEQRVTREQIRALSDTFAAVTVSDRFPYWHFLCELGSGGVEADDAATQ